MGSAAPQPTADELYDRLATAVLDDIRRNNGTDLLTAARVKLEEISGVSHKEFDDLIYDWKDEFSELPEYWQLVLTGHRSGREEAVSNLWRLADAGYASPELYAAIPLLFEGQESSIVKDLNLLRLRIESEPGNGWFHYQYADYLLNLGEPDTALEAVRAGNRCAYVRVPPAFPYSTAIERQNKAQSSDVLAASAFIITQSYPLNYIWIKESYKEVAVCMALGYSPELADEFLVRAVHMAGDRSRMFMPSSATILARIPLQYMHDELLVLDPQLEVEYVNVMRVFYDLDALHEEEQQAGSTMWEALDVIGGYPYYGLDVQGWAGMGRISAAYDLQFPSRRTEILQRLLPAPLLAWSEGRSRFSSSE